MPDTTLDPMSKFFQTSYAPGQEQNYIHSLQSSSRAVEIKAATDLGFGDLIGIGDGVGYEGYIPTTVAHYTPEQAVDLYNKMDPRLADDPEMLKNILRGESYWKKEGHFAPGQAITTAANLRAGMAQWVKDDQHRDRNHGIMQAIPKIMIAAGGAYAAGGAMGLFGEGAGASAAAPAFESGFVGTGALSGAAGTGIDMGVASVIGAGDAFLPELATLGETAAPAAFDVTAGEIPASFSYGTDVAGEGLINTSAATEATTAATNTVASTAGDAGAWESGFTGTGAISGPEAIAGAGTVDLASITNAASSGGLLDTIKNGASAINKWATENPLWTNILGGIGNWMQGDSKLQNNLDVVDKQGQNALDLEKLKNDELLAKNKAYSESVSGLRKPGLIQAQPFQPLTRTDGSRVFGTNGLINARG